MSDHDLERIAAVVKFYGPARLRRMFLEEKICELVERRDNLKSKSDVISAWMVAAINERIQTLGVHLWRSYPRIETKENLQ